jgi:hypothetical protein
VVSLDKTTDERQLVYVVERGAENHQTFETPATVKANTTTNGIYSCKSPHHYTHSQLFPLHKTTMEGIPMWIPHQVHEILEKEYGAKGVSNPVYVWNRLQWRFHRKGSRRSGGYSYWGQGRVTMRKGSRGGNLGRWDVVRRGLGVNVMRKETEREK